MERGTSDWCANIESDARSVAVGERRTRPAPFSAYTTPDFWNDPHISKEMLRFHLDPLAEGASRAHAFIDRSVDWLIPTLGIGRSSRLLDVGCGPGLYANRIAARGIDVVGIDVSSGSLDYARSEARAGSLPSFFRQGNYLECDLGSAYDAAILIYEDYCALSPAQRAGLLSRIHVALLPGGRLVFDVTSTARFSQYQEAVVSEMNLMEGFWADPPYLGTQETWTYPELGLILERYIIQTEAYTREFWNWMHCLSPEAVANELGDAGFTAPTYFGDVSGKDFEPSADSFTVLTQRAPTAV